MPTWEESTMTLEQVGRRQHRAPRVGELAGVVGDDRVAHARDLELVRLREHGRTIDAVVAHHREEGLGVELPSVRACVRDRVRHRIGERAFAALESMPRMVGV
jgi:hypothetical protein